jgi:hypothetical protein
MTMKPLARNIILITFLSALLLTGCLGNESYDTQYACFDKVDFYTSDSGTFPANLEGDYTWVGFDYNFYTLFDNLIKTVDETDFDSFSGDMTIGPVTVDVNYSVAGTASFNEKFYLYGTDENFNFTNGGVTWTDSSSGTILLDGFPVPFEVNDPIMAVTREGFCFTLEGTEEEPPAAASSLGWR